MFKILKTIFSSSKKREGFLPIKVNDEVMYVQTDDERLAECMRECLETGEMVFHNYDENGERIPTQPAESKEAHE